MKSEEPMKALGENCFGGWRVLASILLTKLPTVAFSQGRPDIIWARGGHSYSVNSVAYSPDGQLLVECLELDARARFVRSIPFWAIHGHQFLSR
jgi:hypothetical protein